MSPGVRRMLMERALRLIADGHHNARLVAEVVIEMAGAPLGGESGCVVCGHRHVCVTGGGPE